VAGYLFVEYTSVDGVFLTNLLLAQGQKEALLSPMVMGR